MPTRVSGIVETVYMTVADGTNAIKPTTTVAQTVVKPDIFTTVSNADIRPP
jgi:hypothetical protein